MTCLVRLSRSFLLFLFYFSAFISAFQPPPLPLPSCPIPPSFSPFPPKDLYFITYNQSSFQFAGMFASRVSYTCMRFCLWRQPDTSTTAGNGSRQQQQLQLIQIRHRNRHLSDKGPGGQGRTTMTSINRLPEQRPIHS